MNRIRNMDRRLLTILLIVFVQMVGASMVLPIFPLFARREFDLSPQTITLLISSFFAAQFLAGPIIGRLSDTYGRVPVLIISQIGTALSFAMIGLAPNIWVLLIARIVDGVTGGNIIVAQAYITDIMPREKRTQALGYIFAAFGLGFIFGPAFGGVLSAFLGTRIPFLIAAVAAFLTVILTWRTLDESLSDEQRQQNRDFKGEGLKFRQIIVNNPLVMVLVVAFVSQFAFGLLQSTFALYGEEVLFIEYGERWTNLGIGFLLATIGFGQFFTQMVILPRILEEYGESTMMIIGTILRSVSMFAFALITGPWLAFPGGVLYAIGTGIVMPALQSTSTETVADEVRGGVLGVYQSIISLATIFSTALGGVIFAIRPNFPYFFSSALFALSLIPLFYLRRWMMTR